MICMMLNIYVRLCEFMYTYIYVDMLAVLEDRDQQHPWQTEEQPASWMFSMYVLCYFQSYDSKLCI